MNLNHLRYFVTLAHMEHYTKAAESLHITQPSLTYAIHAMEDEIGLPLFARSGRNVVLTRYGKQFLEEVEPLIDQLEKSVAHMKQVGEGREQLRIGFLSVLGMEYLPRLIADFMKSEDGKDVSFTYHNDLTSDLLKMLEEEQLDLVFCSYEDHHPELEFIPVIQQELVVAVPLGHPLAEKEEISLEETAPYPQIFFNHRSGIRAIVDQLFERIGVKPEIVMEVDEDKVLAGFAAEGFGIAVVPDMYVLDHLPLKRLKITRPDYQRNFYMVHRKDYVPSLALQRLMRFVTVRREEKLLHL